jgi:hypothetical protein
VGLDAAVIRFPTNERLPHDEGVEGGKCKRAHRITVGFTSGVVETDNRISEKGAPEQKCVAFLCAAHALQTLSIWRFIIIPSDDSAGFSLGCHALHMFCFPLPDKSTCGSAVGQMNRIQTLDLQKADRGSFGGGRPATYHVLPTSPCPDESRPLRPCGSSVCLRHLRHLHIFTQGRRESLSLSLPPSSEFPLSCFIVTC